MAKNTGRGSKGLRKNSVPDVVGVAKTTAESQITNAGFTYTTTNENTTNSSLNNTIKTQSISAGTVSPVGTNINLVNYIFSFTPFGAFGFTPFGFSAPPPFGFTPYGFTAAPNCIEENTLIKTTSGMVPAKDIQIGDIVLAPELSEILSYGNEEYDYSNWTSESLTTRGLVETTVVNIVPKIKNAVIWFNNEIDKKYSLTQPIFIKRNNVYQIELTTLVEIGDKLISIEEDGSLSEIDVVSLHTDDGEFVVYQFNCEPQDWFIAGNYLVHNK